MIDGGPFHGGASAELIINDKMKFRDNIEDRLKPVVGIASFLGVGGELQFQLVDSHHRLFTEILQNTRALKCVFLPVFIILRKNDPPSDAAPEPIS
jgi:hypothetical protein